MPESKLTRPMLLLDAHADTPQRFLDEHWNFDDDLQGGHLNLSTAHQGGLSGQFFALWPEPQQWRGQYARRTLSLLDAVEKQIHRLPDQLVLCRSAADILTAHATNRFAVLLGIEGGHAIENSLELLRHYFDRGVRYMTLTWANSNDWADSSGDLDDPTVVHHGGLTDFGRAVVGEMNRVGMMVDISHVSDETAADVLAIATAPVLASHSSARTLTASPRNLSDDLLRAIAARDGAIMVNFYPAFLDETWRQAWNSLDPERQLEQSRLQQEFALLEQPIPHTRSNAIDRRFAARLPRPAFETLIDHIEYLCRVAGVRHVGLGSDFDGICALPAGINSAADLPKIAEALSRRGYDEESVRGVMGENLLRVFEGVEKATF